jgi:preprotein translocase SecE subunit
MKRMSQREPALPEEPVLLEPLAPRRREAAPELSVPGRIVEFGREIRSELRQVAWPNRAEVANSSTVVFIVLVLMVCLMFLLSWAFSHGVLKLLST